jgi:hypothetical protein
MGDVDGSSLLAARWLMTCRGMALGWLGLMAGILWAAAAEARAEELTGQRWGGAPLPLEQLPPALRERVRQAVDRPTLYARGPAESFTCRPAQYYWFLDHPDRAVVAWRRLGAKCVDIDDRGNGRFGWSDSQGSDVSWDTVYRSPRMRIWYAEGSVRAGSLLPLVPVRVVVVLHHLEERDEVGRPLIRHQAEMALYIDSRTASLLTRLVGASAPRLGEQYVAQLEMFYSALSWYLDQHPSLTEALLSGRAPAEPHSAVQVESWLRSAGASPDR